MYKIQLHNVDLQKNSEKVRNNSQLTINFSNQVFNNINIAKIINDKSCKFPLQDIKLSRTLKYPKSRGRITFNYNSFSKNSSSSDYTCHCNETHLKKYTNSDHGHIITGDLNVHS